MNKKFITNALKISCIGGGSFLAGTLLERHKFSLNLIRSKQEDDELLQDFPQAPIYHIRDKITPKPGLPIFGTVSAATPIAPSQQNQVQVVIEEGPKRISQIMKYGFPGMDNIRSYSNYVLSYDRRNKVAHWVFEHLTPENVNKTKSVERAKCDFKPDESIHPYFRSLNSDYKGSGYDRGHLAAAGNHSTDQRHCDQTFYLTNMAPQVGKGFNRDSWNRLESYVRKTARKNRNVFCCTGPLYLPHKAVDGKNYVKYEVIGANFVAVPTHFYKVIVIETNSGDLELESYVMPNKVIADDTPLNVFQVPPETIERNAGLLFFDKLAKSQLRKINGKKI